MADWFDEPPDPSPVVVAPPLSVVSADGDWFEGSSVPDAEEVPASRSPRRPRQGVLAVAACLAILALAGTLVAATLLSSAPDTKQRDLTLVPSAPTSVPPDPWCRDLAAGQPVSTSSPDVGAAAIAGFEDAYYSAGSAEAARAHAEAARAHVAADARVGSVDELAAGIASVPAGTVHCVLAQQVQPGLYRVDLYARRPNGQLDHFKQTIATVTSASAPLGALITSILPRED